MSNVDTHRPSDRNASNPCSNQTVGSSLRARIARPRAPQRGSVGFDEARLRTVRPAPPVVARQHLTWAQGSPRLQVQNLELRDTVAPIHAVRGELKGVPPCVAGRLHDLSLIHI
eukprot:6179465-Prymnesium_polylepis.1